MKDGYFLEGAYKLNTADFSHNFLQNLPFDLFQKNHIMTHIDLSNNQIRVVPPRLLLGLNILEEINFSHNLISLVLNTNFNRLIRGSILQIYIGIAFIRMVTFVGDING